MISDKLFDRLWVIVLSAVAVATSVTIVALSITVLAMALNMWRHL